jgi:DNA-binding GntR family transcriptional regulator
MEQSRSESVIRADLGAVVPSRTRSPLPVARFGEAARGEHVHSEPPPTAPAPAAAARQPRRRSVRAQVLGALRESLLSGDLKPGEVYSAPVLAERFGVSPTPVREAMQQLVSECAVETVPNRGFRVAEHSARDLAELAEVRVLLEVPAVLGLARTLPAERWQPLRPLADATVVRAARGDHSGYAQADRSFHTALLELTGNRQLVLVAEDLHRRARRATDLLARASEHVALLDALAAGDVAVAERVVRRHLAA